MKAKLLGFVACALVMQNCSKGPDANVKDADPSSKTSLNAGCVNNPVITGEGGDPYCFKYNGTYYLYRPDNNSIVYNTSTDLVNWASNVTFNYPTYTSSTDIWAPEVHQIGTDLYLFYANPNGAGTSRDIMAVKLASPTSAGSNTAVTLVGATGTPYAADVNIDPTVYNEGSNYYLLWKHKGSGNSEILIQKLNASNPTQFASGSSGSVLFPDIPAHPINKEHPDLIREGYGTSGQYRYYLFFNSGAGDTQDYKIDYATSSTLNGTYTYKGTMMAKNASRNIYSLGGHSIVRDGSNYRWIVYRAKSTSATGWAGRKPRVDRLFIDASANTATSDPTTTQSPYCPVPL